VTRSPDPRCCVTVSDRDTTFAALQVQCSRTTLLAFWSANLLVRGSMGKKRRRVILTSVVVLVVIGSLIGRPVFHLTRAALRDQAVAVQRPLSAGRVDDASRLNGTSVAEVWDIPPNSGAAEAQLRELLKRAREQGLPISIGGARHSMGGHTISPAGIVVNMLPFRQMSLDQKSNILHVGAGARWADIIPYLDQCGRSVAVMQSFNSFSVGGSTSVNCHGWQHDQPPIASTVEAFRLMKADGSVVRCSRAENAQLFSLALGGYGLFGVILDVDLCLVANEVYRPKAVTFPAEEYESVFRQKVQGADIGMAYGRLCIVPGESTFLREAILCVFHKVPAPEEGVPPLKDPAFARLRRLFFRGSIDSDYGKNLRWKAEKGMGEQFGQGLVSRNQLLNEGVEVYAERDRDKTDILQEYFIPAARMTAFLDRARKIIPTHRQDLLNVTVRSVQRDPDTFLRYADQEMFALVMLFHQSRTSKAEADMQALTRELIDAALDEGGRYYLPYRLHATKEQLNRAYPRARAFFELKRRYDPEERFRNQFYDKYGRH
jgi:FAD/FMN-containing dehydrogenase